MTATVPALTLEKLLVGRAGFALPASPLQRAIARASDGLAIGGDLADADVLRHFGCERSRLGLATPVLVVVVAGVRGGKSLMAACAAVDAVLNADLDALKPHELARFAIVAPTVDNADATFRLLIGHVQAAPALARLLVGEPTSDTLTMRRPDGRVVEIVVVAASRGAVTLRSRWLVGFVLDEVALFGAESQGSVVNAEELLRAGETRLVPGGQAWLISSPFGPSGLLYDLWREHFGKPGRVLVVHAPTRAMNPAFPAEQIEAIRQRSPDVAAREYDAAWVDADTAFLDGALIDAAVRREPLEEDPRPGGITRLGKYVFAWDAATRGNSWTLVGARSERVNGAERVIVGFARQWQGSKSHPLDPSAVIGEVAGVLRHYGARVVFCDQWGADALQAIARAHGVALSVVSSSPAESFARYDRLRTLLVTHRIELAPHPALAADLKSIRKRALANGIRIVLPTTADGRHADMAPSVSLAVANVVSAPERVTPPAHGSPEYWAQEERRSVAASEKMARSRRQESSGEGWWKNNPLGPPSGRRGTGIPKPPY